MKEIKFWANTERDTENFFNTLKAHGCEDDLSFADSMNRSCIGWYVDYKGCVAYTRDTLNFDKHEYKEFFFPIPILDFVEQPVTSDGGSTSYYALTITNKAGEYLSCQVGDVIRAMVGNDFDLGNVLKACRRMYEAAQGRGKKDVTMHYDANKIAYFSKEFADWNEDSE